MRISFASFMVWLVLAAPVPAAAADALVRFTITNRGEDVGDRGKYLIYPDGERKKDLGFGYSGAQAKVPEGTYDILFRYQDGGVKKEIWREDQPLSGTVEETVEMNVLLAQVKYTLTNNGVAVGNKGRFLIYPAGDRKNEMADEPSGATATVAAGVYDVLLRFRDGSVKKETWLTNQRLDGNVEKTVDVAVNMAEAVVQVTRLGQPSKIAWCGVYAPGERDEPVAKGAGGEILAVAEGTYDIGCFYNEAGVSTEQWLKDKVLKGRTEFKAAFDFIRTVFKVLPPAGTTPGGDDQVAVYAPGDRKKPVAKAPIGSRLIFPSGTYDVVMKLDGKSAIWLRVALEGEVNVPFAEEPPSKSLKNLTVVAPEPGPEPVLPTPETAPVAPVPAGTPQTAAPIPEPPAPEVVVVSEGPPPQTLPPWAAVKTEKKKFGGCSLTADATLKVTITNGGVSVADRGDWHVFPAGQRSGSQLAGGQSGGSAPIPAGVYDIRINYEDGIVKKEMWLESVKVEGAVEKTVELAVPVAKVRYVITNNGTNVADRGNFRIFSAGESDPAKRLTGSQSGGEVVVPAGVYDVWFEYADGAVRRETWLKNQKLEGKIDQAVEIGIAVSRVKLTLTNNGVNVADKGEWGLYVPGERQKSGLIAGSQSTGTVVVPEGVYDVGIFYAEGNVKTAKWIPNLEAKGNVEKNVELAVPLADLKIHITRKGQVLQNAWCGVFPEGELSEASAKLAGDQWIRVAEGTADVGCFYSEGGLSTSKWLKQQTLKGKVELAVELDLTPASLTVTGAAPTAGAAAGTQGPNIEIVLDASGSMVAKVAGEKTRMDVAKEVLGGVIQSLPDTGANVALRVYGTAPKAEKNCQDSKLLVPRGPVNKAVLKAAVDSVKLNGYTPIAYNLEQAAADLPTGGNNALVLVTDGIESCGGDPCAVASRLAAQGITSRSFVVGFGIGADKSRFLECIGKYYPALNQAELQKALAEILAESLKPLTGVVSVYAQGVRDKVVAKGAIGDRMVFPAGTYDVVIAAGGKTVTWSSIPIAGDVARPFP